MARLVNSGFETGEEFDAQFDAMTEGWKLFLSNLSLHLTHFGGQTATAMLPMANWAGPADQAWHRLLESLGLPTTTTIEQRIETTAAGVPLLAGTVVEMGEHRLALLVDRPAPGTAFIAAEGRGEEISVSVWAYLHGDGGRSAVERDEPQWRAVLEAGA